MGSSARGTDEVRPVARVTCPGVATDARRALVVVEGVAIALTAGTLFLVMFGLFQPIR
jgi:hypothetical protein